MTRPNEMPELMEMAVKRMCADAAILTRRAKKTGLGVVEAKAAAAAARKAYVSVFRAKLNAQRREAYARAKAPKCTLCGR